MYIENIKLKNFRNYRNENVVMRNGMNVILGNNGEGKTNLLESIYLLSTTRSHRGNDDKVLINYNSGDFASIEGAVRYASGRDRLGVIVHKNGKTLLLNNTTVKKNSEFIGKVNAVLFSPSDMEIITGSPKIRRRLIDIELGKLSPAYMRNLSSFLNCLMERNKYLKVGKDRVMLETYTDMIIEPQVHIIKERAKFIQYLNNYISYFYRKLSGDQNDEVRIEYKSFIKEKQNDRVMKGEITNAYKIMLEKDIALKQTNIGVNREDIAFLLNGRDAAVFSSQGQKRMIVLALKLSIMQIIYSIKKEYPILLLDDVFSELDPTHRNCLLNLLPNSVQTIITTTDLHEVSSLKNQNVNIIRIAKGQAE